MRGSSLKYLVHEGFENIRQNRQISIASVGVLVACLILLGLSALFALNVNAMAGYIESQNEIMVFLDYHVKGQDLIDLDEEIRKIDNISSAEFISSDEGLRQWMEDLGDDGTLLEWLINDNPLQNSYRVVLKDLSKMDETIDEIYNLGGIESISASHDVAESVQSLKKAVSLTGTAIVIILAVVSFMIISNTIRLTVFNRSKEISIMKYVGATDAFIRLPFITEGVVIGLFSAVIAFFSIWGGYEILARYMMSSDASWMQLVYRNLIPFESVALEMGIYFVIGGVFMGSLGSFVFLGKYLKV